MAKHVTLCLENLVAFAVGFGLPSCFCYCPTRAWRVWRIGIWMPLMYKSSCKIGKRKRNFLQGCLNELYFLSPRKKRILQEARQSPAALGRITNPHGSISLNLSQNSITDRKGTVIRKNKMQDMAADHLALYIYERYKNHSRISMLKHWIKMSPIQRFEDLYNVPGKSSP